jgi:hypothetical protein
LEIDKSEQDIILQILDMFLQVELALGCNKEVKWTFAIAKGY